jgi:hypothetical protein
MKDARSKVDMSVQLIGVIRELLSQGEPSVVEGDAEVTEGAPGR